MTNYATVKFSSVIGGILAAWERIKMYHPLRLTPLITCVLIAVK
jgi:hypothetical protein